jgi:hypothetical protein
MQEEIVNRVANSKLKTFDLEEIYPAGKRVALDISQWLKEGIVLVESRFRESLKNTDFTAYKDVHVAVYCGTDAIIPQWAWMLVQSHLSDVASTIVKGDLEQLETELYRKAIDSIDTEIYKDLPVIIKGCSNKPVPTAAYMMITENLQGVARSIMYGEACSAVPVYKKPKR